MISKGNNINLLFLRLGILIYFYSLFLGPYDIDTGVGIVMVICMLSYLILDPLNIAEVSQLQGLSCINNRLVFKFQNEALIPEYNTFTCFRCLLMWI